MSPQTPPTEFSLRLIDKDMSGHKGRVEMFVNGRWGAIFDKFWDDLDASVACHQLGWAGPSIAHELVHYFILLYVICFICRSSYFGKGFGPGTFNGFGCRGNELKLYYCNGKVKDNRTDHTRDASVTCSSELLL